MIFIPIIIAILGICLGSFFNVVIDRIPHNRSIVQGRSQCDFCHHSLAWYDLLPVISYVILWGKCRYCKKKLSIQYPLIELLTSILLVSLFFLENPSNQFQYLLFLLDSSIACVCLILVIMDIKYQLLLDKVLLVFGVCTVIKICLQNPQNLFPQLLVGISATIPLLLIFLFSKGRGMGFGDVKLIFFIGLFLGFPKILIAYYTAFLTGAVVGVILVLGKKKNFSETIAFGPFLILGMVIAFVFGDVLWRMLRPLLGL